MNKSFQASLAFVLATCMGCATDSGPGRLASQAKPDQSTRRPATLDENSRLGQLLNESFDTTATRDEKRRLGADNSSGDSKYERLNGAIGP